MNLYISVIKYRIYPIIPALFLILFPSYYSKNYSSIMCTCLYTDMYVYAQPRENQQQLLTFYLSQRKSIFITGTMARVGCHINSKTVLRIVYCDLEEGRGFIS